MGEELERKLERNKDIAQEIVETTAHRVGRITTIITGAVADVAREVGDLVSDGFEMRDAARRAKADELRRSELDDDDSDAPAPTESADGGEQQALPSSADTDLDIIDAEVEQGER